MAQARVHSLLGDSNIKRHINQTACRASPSIKAAQFIPCGHVGIFIECLGQVRESSTVCLLSCLTNFIASVDDGPTSVTQRFEPLLQDVRDALLDSCESNPSRQYLISPPMYRTSPVWYREGLPEVLTLFSQMFTFERPQNLHLLPSFSTPEYDSGGVHLTPYSGLQFLLHLFDGAQDLLDRLSSSTVEVSSRNSESTRVLEDRVMVLEQDHRRLNRVVDHKIAIDSELADSHQNERSEDCFLIGGLPGISSELVGKEWQTRAVSDVQDVLRVLMGKELPILFVKNATKRFEGAEVTYKVQMVELSDSKAIRRKYGSFFLGGRDKRPDAMKPFSIKNFVTPETNTRISIMKLLAKRYLDKNPGARAKVIGYQPRPVLRITPAQSASDRRIKNFFYVEAVTKFPTVFSPSEIDPIIKRINPNLLGSIRSTFVIISDDHFRRLTKPRRARPTNPDAVSLVCFSLHCLAFCFPMADDQ